MNGKSAAAIDIGSNSCRMLIAGRQGDRIVPRDHGLKITRLAAGVDSSGNLNDAALSRTFAVLSDFKKRIEKADVSKIAAVGTSALREVNNSSRFLDRVREELEIPVDVITGEREAELILKGVASRKNRRVGLVIDIGGGSTEIIFEGGAENAKALSRKVGAVRFTERYVDDPAREFPASTCEVIRDAGRGIFSELDLPRLQFGNAAGVFGVGGTITTLAAVKLEMSRYRPEEIEDFKLGFKEVEKIVGRLAGMKLPQRKGVTGLAPGRADVILAGALILLAFMEEADLDTLKVSDRGVLYGLISESLPAGKMGPSLRQENH